VLSVSGNHNGRVFNIATNQTVSISELTITEGTSSTGGGILNAGALNLNNCAITSNDSKGDSFLGGGQGGGISNAGTLNINDCTLSQNAADVSGGGIFNSGVLMANVNTFSENSSGYGGGLDNDGLAGGSATLYHCTFVNNAGGGIDNTGNMTVTACTIAQNNANGTQGGRGGSGIYSNTTGGFFGGGGTLTINASTIANNSTTGQGGGVSSTGPANFSNDTIAKNSASSGGGIYDDGGLVLLCCTIAGNSATGAGGGITEVASGATAVSLKNTIVANNTAGTANDFSGSCATTCDHNLIGDGKGLSGLIIGVNGNQIGFLSPINPLLGPLQDTGGPTLTEALTQGSPATGRDHLSQPNYWRHLDLVK
jgi:hypothetical protein